MRKVKFPDEAEPRINFDGEEELGLVVRALVADGIVRKSPEEQTRLRRVLKVANAALSIQQKNKLTWRPPYEKPEAVPEAGYEGADASYVETRLEAFADYDGHDPSRIAQSQAVRFILDNAMQPEEFQPAADVNQGGYVEVR